MVDKQEAAHSLPNSSNTSSVQPVGAGLVGPVPARARATSYNSHRSLDHTPERWQPRSSPSSVTTAVTPPLTGATVNNPPSRSMGGSKLYADYMKEIREAQKRPGSFSTQPRDREEQSFALGSMATAVAVKAVIGKGRTKKVGGTF